MADTIRPIPPNVTATLAAVVDLKWSGARDNVSVDHYKVFDNATFLKTVKGRSCRTPPLTPGKHSLRIVAYDAAGNYANAKPIEVTVEVSAST